MVMAAARGATGLAALLSSRLLSELTVRRSERKGISEIPRLLHQAAQVATDNLQEAHCQWGLLLGGGAGKQKRHFGSSRYWLAVDSAVFCVSSESASMPPRAGEAAPQTERSPPDECKRGALIVFEGLDRSGKSSQVQRLVEYIRGHGLGQVQSMRFPDRNTQTGKQIDAYLKNAKEIDSRTLHRLFADNRFEKLESMKGLLQAGTTLVVDRYSYSGVAYSSSLGLDFEWCKDSEAGLLAPDLVVYLDIDPEVAAQRGDYGKERYERLDQQTRIAQAYRRLQDPSWHVVDAALPLDEVSQRVQSAAADIIQKCAAGCRLRHLW